MEPCVFNPLAFGEVHVARSNAATWAAGKLGTGRALARAERVNRELSAGRPGPARNPGQRR